MAPLELETSDSSGNWYIFGRVMPGRSGSLPDNRVDGGRDVYYFECKADDESSTLSRSVYGIDIANRSTREIITTGYELVKEIKDGESYILDIRTARGEPTKVRFTHKNSSLA